MRVDQHLCTKFGIHMKNQRPKETHWSEIKFWKNQMADSRVVRCTGQITSQVVQVTCSWAGASEQAILLAKRLLLKRLFSALICLLQYTTPLIIVLRYRAACDLKYLASPFQVPKLKRRPLDHHHAPVYLKCFFCKKISLYVLPSFMPLAWSCDEYAYVQSWTWV